MRDFVRRPHGQKEEAEEKKPVRRSHNHIRSFGLFAHWTRFGLMSNSGGGGAGEQRQQKITLLTSKTIRRPDDDDEEHSQALWTEQNLGELVPDGACV